MAFLWGEVLACLTYLYFRLSANITSFWVSHLLFGSIVFVCFYIVELIIGNWVHWWERRNCHQPLNVANYAIIAEIVTGAVIIPLSHYIIAFGIAMFAGAIMTQCLYTAMFVVVAGLLIVLSFAGSCIVSYTGDDL